MNWFDSDPLYQVFLKLNIPKQLEKKTIKQEFSNEMKKFISDLEFILQQPNKPHSVLLYKEISNNIKLIRKTVNIIINIYKEFDSCNYIMVENLFNDLMILLKDKLIIANTKSAAYYLATIMNFKRIRSGSEKNKLIAKDLFHIPFEKRYLTKNYRYSISGHPCLYLSSNIHLAWRECDMPSEFYYSDFNISDEAKFICFNSPNHIRGNHLGAPLTQEYDCNNRIITIINYLITYPLILSCSFIKDKHNNAAFYQEYIIPQLLMQWIRRNNRQDDIIGIIYFPCKENENLVVNGFNLAIPAFEYKKTGYCKYLKSIINIHDPICFKHSLTKEDCSAINDMKRYFTILNKKFISISYDNVNNSKIVNLLTYFINYCNSILPLKDSVDDKYINIAFELVKTIHENYINARNKQEDLLNLITNIDEKKIIDDYIKKLIEIQTQTYKKFDKV